MYIGPWQEYNLASKMRRQDWKEHKKLKQFYSNWQKKCKTLGEMQATNELVWGPLFASLNDSSNSKLYGKSIIDNVVYKDRSFLSKTSHGDDNRTQPDSQLLRATKSMKSSRNCANAKSAKEWNINDYNQMKRKSLHASEGDKILYANPKRYKLASDSTLLPSIYKPKDDFRDIESAEKKTYNYRIQKENDRRYNPLNVPVERQHRYHLEQSPIRAAKERNYSKKNEKMIKNRKKRRQKTEKAKLLEKRNPYLQKSSQEEPMSTTYFLPPVNIQVKNAKSAKGIFTIDRNTSYMPNTNDVFLEPHVDDGRQPRVTQPLAHRQRIGSPASDIFEDEVDALLDWTDLLAPEMVS